MAQSRIKSGYLLVGAVLCLALVSLLVDKSSQRVELDSVNPFGSVEDVSLPSEVLSPSPPLLCLTPCPSMGAVSLIIWARAAPSPSLSSCRTQKLGVPSPTNAQATC
eukprot:1824018-Rhodomonas_salina.2